VDALVKPLSATEPGAPDRYREPYESFRGLYPVLRDSFARMGRE
jgi:hypothetical protein